ncbi:MAG TPA: hypothetical protein VI306_08575 [Pyrinomonadaceae bacterium]
MQDDLNEQTTEELTSEVSYLNSTPELENLHNPEGGSKQVSTKESSSKMEVKFDQFQGKEVVFAEEYKNVVNHFNGGPAFSTVVIRTFSLRDIPSITAEKQHETADLFVGDPAEIERLQSLLISKRLLILAGDSELGKTTTAIYLAEKLTAKVETPRDTQDRKELALETFLVSPLDRYDKINLQKLSDTDDVSNRFIILKNAFARSNHDLRTFFCQLNEYSLDQFTSKLKESGLYLVLTTSTSNSTSNLSAYAATNLQCEVKAPSDEMLFEALERRLVYLGTHASPDPERLALLNEQAAQSTLVKQLKTMPRLVRFVDLYLRNDSPIAIETDLTEAIRQQEDLSHWFHNEMTADFDLWCFALALGLTNCAADPRGVPWIDFEFIHHNVFQYLSRDQHLFSRRKENAEVQLPETPLNLTDKVYLTQSRTEITKDPNSLADMISFCDENYSHKLWNVMFTDHRRILTKLLPRLQELAEDNRKNSGQRELCARIIGRLGEIDPERVTMAIMKRWVSSREVAHRANVGALYQGILASNNERYKSFFLEVLQLLTTSIKRPKTDDKDHEAEETEREEAKKQREEQKENILTAIAIYSRIGSSDLTLAMKGLKLIANDRLGPFITDVQRIGRLLERTKVAFAKQTSDDDAFELFICSEILNDLAQRLYNQEASTFLGIQYGIYSLCLNHNLLEVFKELRKWIESSNQSVGVLVALLFLINDGVASKLEGLSVEVVDTTELEGNRRCNPIVGAITARPDAVVEMARFLVTIYEAFSVTFFLPKQVQDDFRKSYLAHLTTWVDNALPIAPCREAMESLFRELMQIRGRILDKPIDKLLASSAFLKNRSEEKRAFVNAVLWSSQS